MALALAHFAFGAAMTTLLIMIFLPRVPYPRTLTLLGGTWALLPDLHWVTPFHAEAIYQFHRTSPLVDLFWLHRTLDDFDPGHRRRVAFLFLSFFFATTVIAELREYRGFGRFGRWSSAGNDPADGGEDGHRTRTEEDRGR